MDIQLSSQSLIDCCDVWHVCLLTLVHEALFHATGVVHAWAYDVML
jgi:hypothetical protein